MDYFCIKPTQKTKITNNTKILRPYYQRGKKLFYRKGKNKMVVEAINDIDFKITGDMIYGEVDIRNICPLLFDTISLVPVTEMEFLK